MEVKFKAAYLEEYYKTGKCDDKKHRLQPYIVKQYVKKVDMLKAAKNTETLYTYNSLEYEVLIGDKKGISAIRINDQYRLEFEASQVSDDVTICNLIELSNHYK